MPGQVPRRKGPLFPDRRHRRIVPRVGEWRRLPSVFARLGGLTLGWTTYDLVQQG
jgi:hypothetical protein